MDDLNERAKLLLKKLNIDEKKRRVKEIEALSTDPTFWKDNIRAASFMKEMGLMQKEIDLAEEIEKKLESGKTEGLEEMLREIEINVYLSGKYDKGNAIISIHAGQGGVDAMDWAQMLSRMYQRYFERKGFKFEIIDENRGEEAGIKNITFLVEGDYVYGYLKEETGTHRFVRLSPFNSDNLRHTSFALVEVLPYVEEDSDVKIKEDDLEWEFYRASSHGGQNVQKVSSAVRLKHKPTGIVVTCQTERYQAQNREYALKLLRARLASMEEEKKREEERKQKGEYKPASWGNQIRNYVLHPYKQVKDTRTKVEVSDVESVLDGDIDMFIEASLKNKDKFL